MPKGGVDVRGRLQRAALELFGERGYDRTTSAAIATRAGVTERTFFRHFADKREVLFDGEAKLLTALTTSIAAAPPMLSPLATLVSAFRAVEPMIEGNRAFAEPRHRVIRSAPALQERELSKLATITVAVALALQERGVDSSLSKLAAQIGMAAFVEATLAWLDRPERSLGDHLDGAFLALRHLAEQT